MSRPMVDELDRRSFLGGVGGAVGATFGLTACGSNGGPSEQRDDRTRKVRTAKGDVAVPAAPKRVACLDPGFSWQTLLEVGVTPVGLPLVVDALVRPVNLARSRRIPSVVTGAGEVDVEAVAQTRPDLILANSSEALDKIYARLRKIAPVAAFEFAFPSDWPKLARQYADAVNRSSRLAAVTAQYDQKVARIKDEHGPVIAAQKWALITKSGSQVFVWGSRASSGPALTAAGARFSTGTPKSSAPFSPLSLEKLDTLSDATVILYGAGTDGKPYADTGSVLAEPLFRRLPAARAGRVYPLPSWFAYCYQDAIAQLDGLRAACAKLT